MDYCGKNKKLAEKLKQIALGESYSDRVLAESIEHLEKMKSNSGDEERVEKALASCRLARNFGVANLHFGLQDASVLIANDSLRSSNVIEKKHAMLSKYLLSVEEKDGGELLAFECFAEDYAHAHEQALNAYPGGSVVDAKRMHPLPSVGDSVWWNDPDDGVSSGPYTVLKIHSESGNVDFADTLIEIRNQEGTHAEVFSHELSPVPSIHELAVAVLNSECNDGCDPRYTVVLRAELMALLDEIMISK